MAKQTRPIKTRAQASQAVKLAKIKDQAVMRQQVLDFLQRPPVLRFGMLAVTLLGTRALRDTWGKDNMGARDLCAGLGALGCVLLAADAGITDKYALAGIAGVGGVAVGQPAGGLLAVGRGAWDSGALIQIDPFQFSSILSGLTS